jgi:hypothetical protein
LSKSSIKARRRRKNDFPVPGLASRFPDERLLTAIAPRDTFPPRPADARAGESEMANHRSGPNKTVAAARRKMGGFPKHDNPARDPARDPFFAFVFEQARAGASFASEAEAREAFAKHSAGGVE